MNLYLYIAAALFAVYYFRRYWLSPWGVYVRHTETKTGGVFMTVRHIRWYPPFLSFERTYHRIKDSYWTEESTGWMPEHGYGGPFPERQSLLTGMHDAAVCRERETEELAAPAGKVKL